MGVTLNVAEVQLSLHEVPPKTGEEAATKFIYYLGISFPKIDCVIWLQLKRMCLVLNRLDMPRLVIPREDNLLPRGEGEGKMGKRDVCGEGGRAGKDGQILRCKTNKQTNKQSTNGKYFLVSQKA